MKLKNNLNKNNLLAAFVVLVAGLGGYLAVFSTNAQIDFANINTIYYELPSDQYSSGLINGAANELKSSLEQASAGPIEITNDTTSNPAINLIINPELPEFQYKEREAFKLATTATGVDIIGKEAIGVQQGVYELLHRLGYRWYFNHPAWYVTPNSLPSTFDINVVKQPVFKERKINIQPKHLAWLYNDTAWTNWGNWKKRNRLDNGGYTYPVRHSWPNFVPDKAELAQAYPDAVCYNTDGTPKQIQPDHPEVIRRATEYATRFFQNDQPGSTQGSAPISPEDGNRIFCDEWLNPVGSYSGENQTIISNKVFGLANEVAKNLKQSHPGKYVAVLSYSNYGEVPTIDLEDNVFAQVTSFSRGTTGLKERVKGFKDKGVMVGGYEYYDVPQYYYDRMPPAGKVNQILDNMQFWVNNEVGHFVTEASDNWGPKGRVYWVVSQMMWDKNADPDALLEDFYTNAFGPAKEPMKRMYQRFDNQLIRDNLNDRIYGLTYRDIEEAMQLASSDEEVKERIRHVLYNVKFNYDWKRKVVKNNYETLPLEEMKSLYNYLWRIKDLQVVTYAEQAPVIEQKLLNAGVLQEEIDSLKDSTLPTVQEADQWLADGLADYVGQELVDAEAIDVNNLNLVPALDTTTAPLGYHGSFGRGDVEVIVPSTGNEQIKVDVALPNIYAKDTIRWYDPVGNKIDEQFVERSGSGATDSQSNCIQCSVAFNSTVPGNYRVKYGGAAVKLNRPAAHDFSTADSQGGTSGIRILGSEFYIYVPENTKGLIIGSIDDGEPMTVTRPSGLSESFTTGDYGVTQPESGFWKINVKTTVYPNYNKLYRSFYVYGVAPLFWNDPNYMLIPSNEQAQVDDFAPQVTITSPQNNAQISGLVNLSADASDNVGIDRVEFYVDGVLYDTDKVSPYLTTFNPEPYIGNAVNITAIVYDTSGNSSESSVITIQAVDSPVIEGDINRDEFVDIVDLSILLSVWGSSNEESDINKDNTVDIIDLSILLSNWTVK